MKVLVTGGAGFIGSHIVDKLIAEKANVFVLDNLSSGQKSNIPSAVPLWEMDIRDPEIIPKIAQENFDYIIHQAAQTSVPYSIEHPIEDCQTNILGLVHILEAARQSKVKRVLFASTAAIYGDALTLPIKEEAPKMPLSFYGLSKLTEESYLDLYWKNFGIEYVVLRYSNVYGERQGAGGEGGVVDIFTRGLLAEKRLNIFGDGEQTRDFIHGIDVASANWQALLTKYPNQAYNISSQTEITLNDFIKVLDEIWGEKITPHYQPPREGDIVRSVLDSSKARTQLEWEPKIEFKQGLTQLLDYLKSHC